MRDGERDGRITSGSNAPSWVGQPLEWSRLEEIERWLLTDAARYDDYWTVHALLTLSEGRLTFARREADSAPGRHSQAWLARLQSARTGFQGVLDDAQANEAQRSRARRGLSEIESLRGETSPAQAAQSPYLARSAWRASAPIRSRLDSALGGYDRITIHHTADVPGSRFDGSLADSILVLQNVQRNHVENRKYGDIGYHFLIDAAGRVFRGRGLEYQGAHAGGVNNVRNIGVCLLGNFEHTSPSAPAMAALAGLLTDLRREHRIPRARVVGHGELKATECPGASLARWTQNYRSSGPSLASLASEGPLIGLPVANADPERVTVSAASAPAPAARPWRSSSTVR
jgi:hypothetical protein